jgi:hypothetical protein
MMREGAGFNTDQARRQLLEECQYIGSLELATNNDIAIPIYTMDLKNRLRDIQTDCRNVCMGSSSESWEPQPLPHPWHSCAEWRSRPQHQKRTYAPQQTTFLFDHVVGERAPEAFKTSSGPKHRRFTTDRYQKRKRSDKLRQ